MQAIMRNFQCMHKRSCSLFFYALAAISDAKIGLPFGPAVGRRAAIIWDDVIIRRNYEFSIKLLQYEPKRVH